MKKAKRKKRTKGDLIRELKRGNETDRLYAAVSDYVDKHAGSVVVIGGIQVQEWPGDVAGKFTIGIQCVGRKPVFEKSA